MFLKYTKKKVKEKYYVVKKNVKISSLTFKYFGFDFLYFLFASKT